MTVIWTWSSTTIPASQTARKWQGMPCRQVCAQVFAQSRRAAASHSFCWQNSQAVEPWWLHPWENFDWYVCLSTHSHLKDWLSYAHLHLEVFKHTKSYQVCHGVVWALNTLHLLTSRQSRYVLSWYNVIVTSMLEAWCWSRELIVHACVWLQTLLADASNDNGMVCWHLKVCSTCRSSKVGLGLCVFSWRSLLGDCIIRLQC